MHDNKMDVIQSPHNGLFKAARKLLEQRRERLKVGQALLDGPHLLAAWLDANRPVQRILLTEAGLSNSEIAALVKRANATVSLIDERLFAEISELPSLSGVLTWVAIPEAGVPRTSGLCLLLDGIQDPGNVGSILRTAAAAGVNQVLLSSACADVWSPKTLRAGMGAQAVLDMVERADLLAFSEQFSGRIAATLLDGATDLYHSDLTGDLAMVFGAEGAGISLEMASKANVRMKIPMAPGIESLNVGAAAAICLYERVRQCAILS
ncbi:MAG: RNA methyltransferase [Formivibrio sp.]|nr:RNA methyltransferase [Formivibrio sp.]